MDRTYSANYFSYKQRLLKNLYGVLFLSLITLVMILNRPDIFLDIKWILVIALIFTCVIYFANRNSKNYVYQINIENNNVIFHGESYSEEWKEVIPAKEINVAFKSTGSRFNIFYILKFKTANNLFEINEHNDWHPDLLVELFEKVKELKGEKIILDEKIIMDQVKK